MLTAAEIEASLQNGYDANGVEIRPIENKFESSDKTTRALPAVWYTSAEMYELERRAIFSQEWQLITHQLRLPEPGSWLRYEVAGFEFVLCRDRQGTINAFHNICRHRAFPLVVEDQGRSSIFACKYHGWSYSLSGKLAKAPQYQDLPDFDKASNSLLPIHVHIDSLGFIWVNLDGHKTPQKPWNKDFEGIDKQPRFKDFNFDEYCFDHAYEMVGDFNWKILADNYNECYHCLTAHPDITTVADVNAYEVELDGGSIKHFGHPDRDKTDPGLIFNSTFYFPNASMTVGPHFLFTQRLVPLSALQSVMKYEVYRHKDASDVEFDNSDALFKRIMSEDKGLCNLAQKNINRGVFVCGELHPRKEKGPLHFQKTVRKLVTAHHAQETEEGREIWPARQLLPEHAELSEKDIRFCSSLKNCTKLEAIEF